MKLELIRGKDGRIIRTKSLIRVSKKTLKKLYYKDKLSSREIAKIYKVNQKSVLNWLTHYNLPRVGKEKGCSLGGIKTGKKRIRNVNLTPSPVLSHILGACLGDGCIYELHKKYPYGMVHQYKVKLNSTDKIFAEQFYNSLRKINLNPTIRSIKTKKENHSNQWEVVASSKPFVKWYKNLDINKIEKIISISELCKKEFIRGFYEAEGSCYLNRKRWLALSISNTDFLIIKLIEKLLKEMNYSVKLSSYQPKIVNMRKAYQLRIFKQKEIKIFFEEIKPIIKRSKYELGI